jgi:hypothetical protein
VELKVPNVAIEITSRKTRKKDTTEKPDLYASLGIKEYFIFDPDSEYLDPPLMGYRLSGTKYERIIPDQDGQLISEELQLRLKLELDKIQFYRLDTGARLLTEAELRAAAEKRAAAAEAEVARLKAELAKRSR